MDETEIARALGDVNRGVASLGKRVDQINDRMTAERAEHREDMRHLRDNLQEVREQTVNLGARMGQVTRDMGTVRPVIERVKRVEVLVWAVVAAIGGVLSAMTWAKTQATALLKWIAG